MSNFFLQTNAPFIYNPPPGVVFYSPLVAFNLIAYEVS